MSKTDNKSDQSIELIEQLADILYKEVQSRGIKLDSNLHKIEGELKHIIDELNISFENVINELMNVDPLNVTSYTITDANVINVTESNDVSDSELNQETDRQFDELNKLEQITDDQLTDEQLNKLEQLPSSNTQKRQTNGKKTLTIPQEIAINAMRLNGFTVEAIADYYNMHPSSVSRLCNSKRYRKFNDDKIKQIHSQLVDTFMSNTDQINTMVTKYISMGLDDKITKGHSLPQLANFANTWVSNMKDLVNMQLKREELEYKRIQAEKETNKEDINKLVQSVFAMKQVIDSGAVNSYPNNTNIPLEDNNTTDEQD